MPFLHSTVLGDAEGETRPDVEGGTTMYRLSTRYTPPTALMMVFAVGLSSALAPSVAQGTPNGQSPPDQQTSDVYRIIPEDEGGGLERIEGPRRGCSAPPTPSSRAPTRVNSITITCRRRDGASSTTRRNAQTPPAESPTCSSRRWSPKF